MKQTVLTLLAVASLFAATISASAQDVTLTIATVDNVDMIRMKKLSSNFTAAHPDIELEWITYDETILRQRVSTDIATGGGRFDIVTLGAYGVSIWADRDWLAPLDNMPADYNVADILPPIRNGLSVNDTLYAAPFYGESSFTMYRTDLFETAGLQMPRDPTWDQIKKFAAELHDPDNEVYGICLRGKPGWGENMALLTAMANSYGARWFDANWQPQFDSDAWAKTLDDYLMLLSTYGPPDASSNGYNENLELFRNGKCGMLIDATVAASAVTNPDRSKVANSVGFALAPGNGLGKRSNWLWTWALAVSDGSQKKEAAKTFVAWATSQEYTQLVAEQEGWANAPPGTRTSLYETPEYLAAAPFAEMTLTSIQAADPDNPTVEDVPYTGIQFVAIPEFQSIGTAVSHRFAKALDGDISADKALRDAQWVTEKVIERARFLEEEKNP
jgi:sorbitol/mannitol transport system substrate-binding protein